MKVIANLYNKYRISSTFIIQEINNLRYVKFENRTITFHFNNIDYIFYTKKYN